MRRCSWHPRKHVAHRRHGVRGNGGRGRACQGHRGREGTPRVRGGVRGEPWGWRGEGVHAPISAEGPGPRSVTPHWTLGFPCENPRKD